MSDSTLPESFVHVLPMSYKGGCITSSEIEHRAQLGIFCGDTFSGGDYNYEDYWFECDRLSHTTLDRPNGDRMQCGNSIIVPSQDVAVQIDGMRVETDFTWQTTAPASCYTFVAVSPPTKPGPPPVATDTPFPAPDSPPASCDLSRFKDYCRSTLGVGAVAACLLV